MRQYYASIDLGSNTCRLMVVRYENGEITPVDAFARVIRLGEGLVNTGRLKEDAMVRAIDAVRVCIKRAKAYPNVLLQAVATEACRAASNGAWFLERLEHETGLKVELISREDEARYSLLGCHSLLNAVEARRALVFDIGGASTEVIYANRDANKAIAMVDWTSIPYGVVTLSESRNLNCATQYRDAVHQVEEALSLFNERHRLDEAISSGEVQLVATSGTVSTLVAIHLGLRRYDREAIDGAVITTQSLENVIKQVQMMSPEERAFHPCIGGDRTDLVLAGCAILEGLITVWPAEYLKVGDRGVRDGVIAAMIAQANGQQPQTPAA
ncbi:MAG: Ppx/GppA family phosphatase [Holosporales bacterium]